MELVFDLISANQLETAIKLEQEGYPADEAATIEGFRLRQSQAGDLFLGAFSLDPDTQKSELVGFICATRAEGETLTHESMSHHAPGGSSVCIHSVCVSKNHRRKGIALSLLREYIARLEQTRERYERALLIAHEELIPLYKKAGFELIGKSSVTHGARPWYEMRFILGRGQALSMTETARPESSSAKELPPGVWEALQASSSRRNRPSRMLASFENGIEAVAESSGSTKTNKLDLLCPRCGSLILLQGVSSLVEEASVQIDPPDTPAHPLIASLPSPPALTNWWLITPSPMKFENIGFSRPVEQLSVSPRGKRLKLLACAECDLGPLGWSEEGGTDFRLAASRVAYRS